MECAKTRHTFTGEGDVIVNRNGPTASWEAPPSDWTRWRWRRVRVGEYHIVGTEPGVARSMRQRMVVTLAEREIVLKSADGAWRLSREQP